MRLQTEARMVVQTRIQEFGRDSVPDVHLGFSVSGEVSWPEYRGVMLTPAEARQVAASLVQLADEAEQRPEPEQLLGPNGQWYTVAGPWRRGRIGDA